MVSPTSLYVFAAVLVCLAAVMAWLRRAKARDVLGDGLAALAGTSLILGASVVLFALSQPLTASELWRDAGSVTLLASGLGPTLALRYRGRRSIPRALFTSTLALAFVALWLTLNFRGPRGGWTWIDLALVWPAAATALASAACFGWWSKHQAVTAEVVDEDG